ncbi:protoporphyrinogen/coproporphyrinogen oxidase [Aquimarina agarilytica]|uniref:protoporphyrinogen/coproporphyrinogen oxidase n=1 Tax=Aquimarina agarilytica TaxID=1087449 RepID=UPI000289ADCC|nr:FAD-dependent oxidoreductase [Aquimarina agarilytica]
MKQSITIIGAGVSGLVAAIQLELLGYEPTIFEANEKVGGRVRSDVQDGYILDHGFQVLLSAYPQAQKYLDFNALDLDAFESGAYIFKGGKQFCIGDPIKDTSLLFSTIFSKIGVLSDKLKIFKLTRKLKNKTIEQIFEGEESRTIDYLKAFEFSEQFIVEFFKPFFGGIFLESELNTSSRMFEFIFKMFSEGKAVIPRKGMQEIPNQLTSKLKATKINFSTKVEKVVGDIIYFSNGDTETSNFIIVATEASKIIPQLAGTKAGWKGTQTLYFEVDQIDFNRYMIGLITSEENRLINSVCYPKSILSNAKHKLLSVSIIKQHQLTHQDLIAKVTEELKLIFDITPIRFLKVYDIPYALPELSTAKMTVHPSETQLTEHIFLAGDTLLNGSLNAAMHSGELVAKAIHEKITGTMVS